MHERHNDGTVSPDQPPGLHPLGQLDGRFAVSYETTVPASLGLVARYFSALAARDVTGVADVLHFPFASYEGVEPILVESREQFVKTPPRSMNVAGVGPSHVREGSYDILDGIELQVCNPVGAGVSMTYSRYGPDGHRLLRCEGIYAVTNNDGRWGIELLSTIFTLAGSIPVWPEYHDNYYDAFVRDPDGHNVEAVCHSPQT